MTFVDTNYFLRFLLKDNLKQYSRAKQLFSQAAKGEVDLISSVLVFFEISWVLSSVYSQDKAELTAILLRIMSLSVTFENKDLVLKALELFEKSNLSLVDCYNLVFARKYQTKEFKTFDTQLSKKFNS